MTQPDGPRPDNGPADGYARDRGQRLFDLPTANALLPTLRPLILAAQAACQQLVAARQKLEQLDRGEQIPPPSAESLANDWPRQALACKRRLAECLEQLRALGVEPQNVLAGLVDFPAVAAGRRINLCWQLDEPEVIYWHDHQAGLEARRPIAELPGPLQTTELPHDDD